MVWLFLWVGCGMHKEMNAFKGVAKAMTDWWILHADNVDVVPMKLMNRDN
jgi:hypothetical protein